MGCIGSRGIESKLRICYNLGMGNQSRAAYPLLRRGNPPDERKEAMPMCVTYTDLIQLLIFIVALVSLCYEIFKDKRK